MAKIKPKELIFNDSDEIIFAFVKPLGTDLSSIKDKLKESSSRFSLVPDEIDVTDFIKALISKNLKQEIKKANKKIKIRSESAMKIFDAMTAGSKIRKLSEESGILSAIAILSINHIRNKKQSKRIYLIDSLKTIKEVTLLRKIYKGSFFLIAASTSQINREKNLIEMKNMTKDEAIKLIMKDEEDYENELYDAKQHGQQMQKVFEMADFYLDKDASIDQINRLMELVFGNSNISPTRHEYYMNLAASSAALSSDLSRQVGAVLVSEKGEIISLGTNEVPKFGGGQYSYGLTPDFRDVIFGYDPNHKKRKEILKKIDKIAKNPEKAKIEEIDNLIEYQRAIHAEMEALLSATRIGVSTTNSILYCTTFPCHNCAKHLVAAGISQIFYIQAYPKSLAISLHNDSIAIDESEGHSTNKMLIKRYFGIGPRRFLDFFSESITSGKWDERKKGNGEKEWERRIFEFKNALPRFQVTKSEIQALEDNVFNFLYNTGNSFVKNIVKKIDNLLKKKNKLKKKIPKKSTKRRSTTKQNPKLKGSNKPHYILVTDK